MTGEELKTLRQSWRMTQAELATRLGVSATQIAAWENERDNIPGRVAIHLADIDKLRAIREILDSS